METQTCSCPHAHFPFLKTQPPPLLCVQTYYPDLLWPTKERRNRQRASSGKSRPQKQRGKMNQDGKGGRSANS